MVLVNFYYDDTLLGGYSIHSEDVDYDHYVHTLYELSDDYDVPRAEIKTKVERI